KDLFVANGHIYPQADKAGNSYRQRNQLFRNLRNGRFALVPDADSGFTEARSSRGAAWGDLNNDGLIELVVNNIDQEPFLYAPSHQPGASWARFKLVGSKTNLDAIGARVRVTANGITQTDEVRSGESYISTCDFRLHFGLGGGLKIDRVEIRWPNGHLEVHEHLDVKRE